MTQEEQVTGPVRRPKKAEVRQRLLTAAATLFLEKGYADSTLDDIARTAGLSKGAVYSNFDSKQEIFGVLLAQRRERLYEVVDAAMDDTPGRQVDGRTGHRATSAIAANIQADSAWIQLVLEFASRSGRDEAVRELYMPFLRIQQDAVAKVLAGEPDPDLLGLIVIALRNGLALAHTADPERVTADVVEQALHTVLTGVLTRQR